MVEAGWTQFALTNGRGQYCLRAAIGLSCGAYAVINGRVTTPRLDYAAATVEELAAHTQAFRTDNRTVQLVQHLLPAGHDSIPEFNDDASTSLKDVLAVLDEAIRFEDAAAKVWAS
jgi:hypothetical protein